MSGAGWTPERVDLLRKLWDEGLTCSECAIRLGGVTRNAIIGKVHRLGLALRGHTPVSSGLRKRKKRRKTMRQLLEPVRAPRRLARADYRIRSAAPKEPVVPYVEPPITETPRITNIIDLGPEHCRWPIGDPRQPGFGYCGCQPLSGLSYCAPHARLVYNSVQVAVRMAVKYPQRDIQREKELA